jgi:phosphonate transport system substrate-binding protein
MIIYHEAVDLSSLDTSKTTDQDRRREYQMMKQVGKKIAIFAMIIAIMAMAAACGGQKNTDEKKETEDSNAGEFTIAVIPQQNQGDMQKAMNKLAGILQKKLNRNVSINVYPDYNGVVEAMNFGQVDMAYFGPLTYVIAHHESGAEAIVTQLIKGSPFYYSYIITHKDQPWNSLDDLLKDSGNVSFAFGDPNSTSGSLIPGIELKKRGVYTDESTHQFKELRFTGSHDVTALAVQNRQMDAGAIDSAIYDTLVEQKKINGDQFKIIWKSEKLFQYPWAVKKGTDQKTIDLLREAFIGIKDEEVLNAFGASAFTKAENKDYEAIREAAEKEGRLKSKK